MDDTYWKRCPRAEWESDPYAEYWHCTCHGVSDDTLLPVVGALLIEDAERARRIIEIAADQLEDEDCPKIAKALRWLLGTAVGEGEAL